MKVVLHNQAIANVVQKIDAPSLDYIVIDQFAERGVYQRYALSDLPFLIKQSLKRRVNLSH